MINYKALKKLKLVSALIFSINICNAGELLHQIQTKQHQLSELTLSYSKEQIMRKVIDNYDYLNQKLYDALDTIWNNETGELLLRSFCENMRSDSKALTILWNKIDIDGSSNKIFYDSATIYIDESQFVDYIGYRNGEIVKLPETLDAMLFHEITHGYHNLLGFGACERMKQHVTAFRLHWPRKSFCLEDLPFLNKSYLFWIDDEEIHTITGWIVGIGGKHYFDCLNTNSYMVLQELKKGISSEEIVQRIFHCDYGSLIHINPDILANLNMIAISNNKFA